MSKPRREPDFLKPWGTSAREWHEIVSAAQQLVGHSIAKVSYVLPDASSAMEYPPVHLEGFDWISHVGTGVDLEMTNGEIFSAIWVMEGHQDRAHHAWTDSGLLLDRGRAVERSSHPSSFAVDVSATAGWRPLLGERITHVRVVWETMERVGAAAAWSVRIDFESAPSVVIALGEFDEFDTGGIRWMPHKIVVIFDDAIAKGYGGVCAYDSAYGSEIPNRQQGRKERKIFRLAGNPPGESEQYRMAPRELLPEKPWGSNATEWDRIVSAAHQLIGHSIAKVKYMLPSTSSEKESPPMHLDGFDWISPVGMAVELEMTNGEIFSAIWVMEGHWDGAHHAWMDCGLSLDRGVAVERSFHSSFVAIDVSATSGWRPLLLEPITHVRVVWETMERDGAAAAWSVRIDFEQAPSVVIALGEFDFGRSNEIRWSPDDIVVIFDHQIAEGYASICAYDSAYGSEIADRRSTRKERKRFRQAGNPPGESEQRR